MIVTRRQRSDPSGSSVMPGWFRPGSVPAKASASTELIDTATDYEGAAPGVAHGPRDGQGRLRQRLDRPAH